MSARTILVEIHGFCSVTIEDDDHRTTMSDEEIRQMEEENFRDDPMVYFSTCDQHTIKVDVVADDTTSVQETIPGLVVNDD